MAQSTHTFIDNTLAGLTTQVNAFLATLIGGASVYILQVSVLMNAMQRRGGAQFQATISTTTSNTPPALATPFTLQFISAPNPSAFDTATAVFLASGAASFCTGWRLFSDVRDTSLLPAVTAWALANATVGAGANYSNT